MNDIRAMRQRIADLERKLEDAEYQLAYYKRELSPPDWLPPKLGLTRQEGGVLKFLVNRPSGVSHDQIYSAICESKPECDHPGAKITAVVICKLRKKLARHNIRITSVHGLGYMLKEADRTRIISIIAEGRSVCKQVL
jgi:DNA-binding response OmpR family regulator